MASHLQSSPLSSLSFASRSSWSFLPFNLSRSLTLTPAQNAVVSSKHHLSEDLVSFIFQYQIFNCYIFDRSFLCRGVMCWNRWSFITESHRIRSSAAKQQCCQICLDRQRVRKMLRWTRTIQGFEYSLVPLTLRLLRWNYNSTKLLVNIRLLTVSLYCGI